MAGMRPGGGPGSINWGNRGPGAGSMAGMRPGGGPGLGSRPGGPGSINRGDRGPGGGQGFGGRPGAGGGSNLNGRPSFANMRGPGGRYTPTNFNRSINNVNNLGSRGLGWRDNYAGIHRNWGGHGGGGGNWGGRGGWNNGWGGRGGWNNGWGGHGGGWNNGWGGGWNNGWGGGGFGNGFGWGLGLGLGSSLGWGLGGWGLGGLGGGLGGWGLGWGNGLGWGLGGLGWGGGWGLGGLGWGGGWGLGGLGWGGGWGLSSWAYGPMLYDWGYTSYYNPYYVVPQTVVVQEQPLVYDYSQPINPTAAPPEASVVDDADGLFDKGREAFKMGLYTAALDFADQALRQMPNDPTLHEFRALSLFAMKRYDDAAAALYPVLSIGPGWDWPTLIGLYGDDAGTYTNQLRALETRVKADPNDAPAHFLLGYHYLCQGHGEEALGQLRAAAEIQPRDQLSSGLVKQLEKARREALGPDADAKPAAAPARRSRRRRPSRCRPSPSATTRWKGHGPRHPTIAPRSPSTSARPASSPGASNRTDRRNGSRACEPAATAC
ncbi:tetratricopeptide repeat protein [Planctomyces sp. SH-PL62]|uniref:tetratricopeptide repeat protein n=1 Tax=Planctomyces sp. SH-PL62 TaxID=1636152 RepID=UPI0012E8112B|nr:tetratricopeptide repeat protein [Planctomyces sp. SH-PL62]